MQQLSELLLNLRGTEPLRDVAQRAEISHTYLHKLERSTDRKTGKQIHPSAEILQRIARAYNYSYEELLKAAGYLLYPDETTTTDFVSAKVQKIINCLIRAKDLFDEDYDAIGKQVELLIKFAQKKNRFINVNKK